MNCLPVHRGLLSRLCKRSFLPAQHLRIRAMSSEQATSTSATAAAAEAGGEPHPTYIPGDPAAPAILRGRVSSKFCRMCASPLELRAPPGDGNLRHVCTNASCGYIDYFNTKMVVGAIVEHPLLPNEVLLCRRNIEPQRGFWTLPAGYAELAETTAEGAARETYEEAHALVDVIAPFSHLDIPAIGQTYILFRAQLKPPYSFGAGPETIESKFFKLEDIPFSELAFSSVRYTLEKYVEDSKKGTFAFHYATIEKDPRGSAVTNFKVRDTMEIGPLGGR